MRNKLKLPAVPTVAQIDEAIRARRDEIADLKQLRHVAEVRELRKAIAPRAREEVHDAK